jgi:hypothetical protein
MAVEVRGPDKHPLFGIRITFEVEPLADDAPRSALDFFAGLAGRCLINNIK